MTLQTRRRGTYWFIAVIGFGLVGQTFWVFGLHHAPIGGALMMPMLLIFPCLTLAGIMREEADLKNGIVRSVDKRKSRVAMILPATVLVALLVLGVLMTLRH